MVGDEPKGSPVDLPLLSRSRFKAHRAERFLVWTPLMHKFAHLTFFARIALCQNFPVKLAGVADPFGHSLLQVRGIGIDFARLGLTWVFGWDELRCANDLPNGFAISSNPTGNLADRDHNSHVALRISHAPQLGNFPLALLRIIALALTRT